MPPPRRGGGRGHYAVMRVRRRSVRLMSRTSALTRKPNNIQYIQRSPKLNVTVFVLQVAAFHE